MTTTHKSLRGPRGAMIFFRKGVRSVDKKGKGKFGWLAGCEMAHCGFRSIYKLCIHINWFVHL